MPFLNAVVAAIIVVIVVAVIVKVLALPGIVLGATVAIVLIGLLLLGLGRGNRVP
jgi:hypothetical protein